MPATPSSDVPSAPGFAVHADPDALRRADLAAAARRGRSSGADAGAGNGSSGRSHRNADDGRQAARRSSDRARSGRAAGAGGGRSYAFRRS